MEPDPNQEWSHCSRTNEHIMSQVIHARHAAATGLINTQQTHAHRTILQITIIVYNSSINTFLYWFLPYCPGGSAGLQPETKAALLPLVLQSTSGRPQTHAPLCRLAPAPKRPTL